MATAPLKPAPERGDMAEVIAVPFGKSAGEFIVRNRAIVVCGLRV
jgi:hypothetical protein